MDHARVRCPAGTVVGRIDGEVDRYTGIRYAMAERFGKPEAQPETSGEIDATRWSPRCPQRENPLQTEESEPRDLGVDEQCQYLSVTVPHDAMPGEVLPVMVWIHGGSYETGGGDETYSDPALLVAEQRLIVVTVTYRLGPLGFLGDDERPANLGLLDQIEALRWVARNISAFGGDPESVTLFGQSAGADAIAHLMIADGASGLFQRAIIQSPPLGITLGRKSMSSVMSRRLGDLPDVLDNEQMVAEQERLVRGLSRFGWVAAMPFGVQYGHDPLPSEDELDQAWSEAAPRVDVLIGSNNRETALFAELTPAFARLRRTKVGTRLYEAAVERTTRHIYDDAIDYFTHRHRAAGGHASRYMVDWGAGPRFQGAHVIELALLFPTHAWAVGELLEGVDLAEVQREGRAMRDMWARFARTGRTGTQEIPGVLRVAQG
ncbi:MAG: carboxylesterase family protein [Propionibacteriaceae bacterium]|nr:carboxylesterase family protein [Propionibacteriaceae bacterium]